MKIDIIKTLKLTKEDKEYLLNVGDVISIKTKQGEEDLVQLTAINEKSISVGSYTNPMANPRYIKFKDIEEITDIYNEKEPTEDDVTDVEYTTVWEEVKEDE